MKNFKKVVAMMLAMVMVFALAACGNNNEGGGSSSSEEQSTEATSTEVPASGSSESTEAPAAQGGKTYKIGVTIYKFDDNFMTSYRKEIEKYFGEVSQKDGNTYELEFQDGKNDQATQTEQVKTFISQKKDLIIANFVDPTGADEILKSAKEAQIPVVMINREPPQKSMEIWPGKTTYVGVDARQSGVFQGEMIAELKNHGDVDGDGKVAYLMIMGDAGNVDAEQRTQYSVETLEKTIKTEKLDEQRGNWDAAKGQEIAANALAKYGKKLEVIFSNNDAMASGAVQAIKAANRKINEDIYVVGVDAIDDVMAYLKNGEFTGTVLNDAFNQSHTTVETAIKLLNGEDVKPYYWHDYVKVTKPEDADVKRVDARPETIEEYQKRLKDTYGITE